MSGFIIVCRVHIHLWYYYSTPEARAYIYYGIITFYRVYSYAWYYYIYMVQIVFIFLLVLHLQYKECKVISDITAVSAVY